MISHTNPNAILNLFMGNLPEHQSLCPTHSQGLQSCPLTLNLRPPRVKWVYLAEVELFSCSELLLCPQLPSSPISRMPLSQPTVEGRTLLLCEEFEVQTPHRLVNCRFTAWLQISPVQIKKCTVDSLHGDVLVSSPWRSSVLAASWASTCAEEKGSYLA